MPTAYSIKKYFTLEVSGNIAKPAANFQVPSFQKVAAIIPESFS